MLSIISFSITTLSTMTLSIKESFATFSIMTLGTTTVGRYAECRVSFIVILSVMAPLVVNFRK
jgi:hypothetical protein